VKALLKWLIQLTKPLVWRIAEAYDLRVDRPRFACGQHPLVIMDDPITARRLIPRSVYFNTRCGQIVVGKNTVFGEDAKILTGKHMNIEEARRNGVELHHVPEHGRDIVIGSGCYIGSNAILIGPVEIGDYAVIGAGAVVTKSVPERTFVAGVPAKVVYSFPDD